MARVDLTLHWTGSCRHPECSTVRGGSWAPRDYPMYAAVIERRGELTVVDPGYSPRFFEATRPFPERLYRWATPAACPPEAALSARLKAAGRLEDVRRVVVTHFHADHVSGLLEFPDAEVWCSREAWLRFRRSGRLGVRSGYLQALAPKSIEPRLRFVDDLPRRALPPALADLGSGWDVFGDGSCLFAALPGHASGQIGASLECEDGRPRFLAADAAWSSTDLAADRPPPWITRRLLGSPSAYMRTWRALRAAVRRDPDLAVVPAHCADAARREEGGGA